VIGKLPEQRIREIFFESPALNELKEATDFQNAVPA